MPDPPPDLALTPLQQRVADALERFERDGQAGLDTWCSEHPADAARVLRQLRALVGLGLVESGDEHAARPPAGGHAGAPRPARAAPAHAGSMPTDAPHADDHAPDAAAGGPGPRGPDGEPIAVSLEPGSAPSSLSIGPYRLHEPVGHGGMGVVWRAFDPDGKAVALKVLAPGLLGSPTARERFRREVSAVAGLRHPGFVPVIDVGEDAGTPYFAMELVDGPSLAEVLMRVREVDLSLDQLGAGHLAPRPPRAPAPVGAGRDAPGRSWIDACCRLVMQLADALHHAHGRGVVHRDVKPGNVLLVGGRRPRLVDFGLAATDEAGTLTLTGDFAGTPHYAPPEHVRGQGARADPRTDVYALGVTLYELLTLQRPFEGATNEQVLWQIVHAVPTPLRTLNPLVSRDLATVCATAMERDRSRRYRDARELHDDLARVLDGRSVHARAPGPLSRTWRWARRRPAVSLATLLAVVLAVGVPTGLWQGSLRLQAEVDRKNNQMRRLKQLNDVFVGMLQTPTTGDGQHVRVVDTLDLASERAAHELSADPDMEIALRRTLASAWRALEDPESARAELSRVLELVEQLPERSVDGDVEIDRADTLVLGGRAFERARSLYELAGADLGQQRFQEARDGLLSALQMFEALPGHEVWQGHCLHFLAAVHRHRREFDEADAAGERALALFEAHDASRVHVGRALVTLALAARQRAEAPPADAAGLQRARALLERALGEFERAGREGLTPLDTGRVHLGELLLAMDDTQAALEVYDALLATLEGRDLEHGGAHDATLLNARWGRARVLRRQGHLELASARLAGLVELIAARSGEPWKRLAELRLDLGSWLLEAGRPDEAAAQFMAGLADSRAALGDRSGRTSECLVAAVDALTRAARHADVDALLEEFEALYRENGGEADWLRVWCVEQLIASAERAGDGARAARWRTRLPAPETGG